MTSPRQLEANRANARASTGPKTQAGRARAALNALRHGLAVSVLGDIVWGPQVEVLARRIAGERADAELLEAASAVAAAQIELNRHAYQSTSGDRTGVSSLGWTAMKGEHSRGANSRSESLTRLN